MINTKEIKRVEKTEETKLQQLYKNVNELVKSYKDTDLIQEKNYILTDLITISEKMIRYNCRAFLTANLITDISEDDLYSDSLMVLYGLLDTFDFKKHNNFMVLWGKFNTIAYGNRRKQLLGKQRMWERNQVSLDKNFAVGEDGACNFHNLAVEDDFAEDKCSEMVLSKLIKEFEEVDKHGFVIKCLLIRSKGIRTELLKKGFGSDSYGATERKKVQRAKERFSKFLTANSYDLSGFLK